MKTYMVTLGISDDRLATISLGEEHPALTGQNKLAWAKNRRSEFK